MEPHFEHSHLEAQPTFQRKTTSHYSQDLFMCHSLTRTDANLVDDPPKNALKAA